MPMKQVLHANIGMHARGYLPLPFLVQVLTVATNRIAKRIISYTETHKLKVVKLAEKTIVQQRQFSIG